VNECKSITQFEQLLPALQKRSEVESALLKEKAAELKRVAESLSSQFKANTSNNFENLYDHFTKKVMPVVDNFFKKAVTFNNKVGHLEDFFPNMDKQTQTIDITQKVETETQTNIVPPKQPNSPSRHYILANRTRCKAKNPNCNAKGITKILREEWENMSNFDRLNYVNIADKDRKKYREELKEFTALGGSLPAKKFKKEKREEE